MIKILDKLKTQSFNLIGHGFNQTYDQYFLTKIGLNT